MELKEHAHLICFLGRNRALIPMHPSLRFAGILPPLDAPHHLRATEWSVYREGVVQDLDIKEGRSFVDVGLEKVSEKVLLLDFVFNFHLQLISFCPYFTCRLHS